MLVPQESHIFSASVRENVGIARPDASDDEVRRALATTGALTWVDDLDDGWDTRVGSDAGVDSGEPIIGIQNPLGNSSIWDRISHVTLILIGNNSKLVDIDVKLISTPPPPDVFEGLIGSVEQSCGPVVFTPMSHDYLACI